MNRKSLQIPERGVVVCNNEDGDRCICLPVSFLEALNTAGVLADFWRMVAEAHLIDMSLGEAQIRLQGCVVDCCVRYNRAQNQ